MCYDLELDTYNHLQQKVMMTRLVSSSDQVANMGLATLVPGDDPITINKKEGSTVVQREYADDIVGQGYTMDSGGLTIEGFAGGADSVDVKVNYHTF